MIWAALAEIIASLLAPTRPAHSISDDHAELAAKWHVCPQTHRLECSWSLEAAPLTINYVVTQCKDVAGERLAAV